jgi:formamidopyrimidine-DNA glycosylase
MPELPEVETTCRGISPHIKGQPVSKVIVRDARLRWPVDPELNKRIAKKTIKDIQRRAKYLLLCFSDGILVIHLGMSGSLRVLKKAEQPQKHDHVDLVFKNGKVLRFRDPRRFGAVLWLEGELDEHKLFKHLGPEPLSNEFSDEYLFRRSRGRQQSIKQFIMSAETVVGVGNIYANEALFAAGIHPERKAGSLSKKRLGLLVETIKEVLSEAIKQGGSSLKDFEKPDGQSGYFVQYLQVYGKKGQPCPQCERPLEESRLGKRSTVFCRKCQR